MCLKGKVGSEKSVWCSAGWNYEYTLLPLNKAYPSTNVGATTADATAWDVAGGTADSATGKKGDQGACCYT